VNISEQVRQRKYRKIKTPFHPKTGGPICVKCDSRITGDECLQSIKRDGFYLHLECGEFIGVEVID